MLHCPGAFAVKRKNAGEVLGFSGFFSRKGIFVFANGYFKGGRGGYPGFNSGNKTFKFGIGAGF